MIRFKVVFSSYLMFGLMIFGFAAQADAQGIRNERNVRDITRSLNSKVDDLKYSLDNELSRNSTSRDDETEINDNLRNFETSLDKFEDKFQRRRENADDVRDVLSAAKSVNDSLISKRFGAVAAERDWASIRTLLERLASNYQVAWNWNEGNQT
ncbi:MAG: hypothetical protein M3367_11810, partial [Acidobacteriota bacterium]|nr:hypothetical protein [Acidobacteriota bacterium]